MMARITFNRLINEEAKQKYRSDKLTKQEIFDFAAQFRQSIAENSVEAKGWPKTVYGMSKLSINLYCSVLSKSEEILKRGIQVYSCCPGYVATDMTSHKGILPVS